MRLIPDKFNLALQRDLTLGNFHDRIAELRGDKAFSTLHEPLRYQDFPMKYMSYQDAARFVEKVSSALRDLGVRREIGRAHV